MRWRVEISEGSGDDRLLRDVLGALSIGLHEQAGERSLISDRFETLDSAVEVHALASRVQSIVAEIGRSDPDIQMSFRIDGVLEEPKNGGLRKHMFVTASGVGTCAVVGHGVAVVVEPSVPLSEAERKRIEEREKERAYQRLRRKAIARVVSAFRDDHALQVQRLLQSELTPQTMGHIADLIQDDIGGAMRDLISGNQLTRFYRSINHPDVFGEHARHIVSNAEPPPNPMSLDEAREFTRDLATRWLENKAGLNDNA